MYLEVRDIDTSAGSDARYPLDTPSATIYSKRNSSNNGILPLQQAMKFFPSSNTAADFLPSPLEYAAKWGGIDSNNNKPDLRAEWDENDDGLPDTYSPPY